jgi:DNA-directed RNA polymerase specialized sigma24 family protein
VSGREVSGTEAERAVVELLAAVIAAEGHDGKAVAAAFAPRPENPERHSGRVDRLEALVEHLRAAAQLDVGVIEPPAGPVEYFPEGHRWEHWRMDDPEPLADTPLATRELIVHALRQLPLAMRALLVLRDAAHLAVEDAARIVSGTPAQQAVLLDRARTAFVAVLDRELARGRA